MNILYVGSGAPWSGGAGYLVRQNMFLNALVEVAKGSVLHLALFDFPENTSPPPFQAKITKLITPVQKLNISKIHGFLLDCMDSMPRVFRDRDCSPARLQMMDIDPTLFDLVFAYRIDFAYFAGLLFRNDLQKSFVLDVDDPEHIRAKRRLEALKVDIDWRTARDIYKLQRFEYRAVSLAKRSFVCQTNDANSFPSPTPLIVPNCVPLQSMPRRQIHDLQITFVGNCAENENSPNVDAVCWFVTDVWPLILERIPEARFDLIGRVSPKLTKTLLLVPNVRMCGYVENLAEAYSATAVCVAPIRFGTGTRIKILEAMAHACPVISTHLGAEGIDASDGSNIVLATNASAFSAACIELLSDTATAEKIGRAGYELIAKKYDSVAEQGRLIELLETQEC